MMDDREDNEMESSGPPPMAEEPGVGDNLLNSFQAVPGIRRSPGPSTVGAATPQLNIALQALLEAQRLDPPISEKVRSMITGIMDIMMERQHVSTPMSAPVPAMPPASRLPNPLMKTMAGS